MIFFYMQVATKNKKVGYRRVIMVCVRYVILILFKFRQADVLGFTSLNFLKADRHVPQMLWSRDGDANKYRETALL